ncbi:hypothetical protein JCM8202v2_005647 [Rhodotorula sphaerocarpa]
MAPVFGAAPRCPTCGQAVYFAEKVIGPGGTLYHKLCLKCNDCGKSLEPRLLVDHDGVAYCKSCYGKNFGAKGYGAGGALVGEPSFSEDDTRQPSFTNPAVRPTEPASSAPTLPARPPQPTPPKPAPKPAAISARPSFSAVTPSAPEPAPEPTRPAEPEALQPSPVIVPAAAPPPNGPPAAMEADLSAADTKVSAPDFDDDDTRSTRVAAPAPAANLNAALLSRDVCPRCQTVVYHAEAVSALARKWHKRCLRCAECGTTLQPGRFDERDGEPFCKRCYTEKFGLTGGLGVMTRPNLF